MLSPTRRVLPALLALLSLLLLLVGMLLSRPMPVLAQADPTPQPLYALPDARSNPLATSNSLAFSDASRLLVAVNPLNDTVSIVAPVSGELRSELQVGDDPRGVAITDDGAQAVVVNRGDASLTLFNIQAAQLQGEIPLGGIWAYGIVISEDNTAYVSMQGSDEIVVVDLLTETVTQRIPTPPLPTGLALWGDFLYVTHLWSGDVSLIYLPQSQVVETVRTGAGLTPALDIDITRGLAYLPQTRSYADNPALTYDTTVFPVVNVLTLAGLNIQRQQRINLETADRPVNMPFAVQVDTNRRWVYTANAGSDDISVVEIESGRALAHIDVGANPRGLLLNGDNSILYVHNVIDGTVSVINTSSLAVVDTIPISTQLSISVDVLIGADLFHSANDERLANGQWLSCATCHLDGLTDGRTWADFPGGPRNTPLLLGVAQTAPYNWSATWDELADSELKIRGLQAGEGLIEDDLLNDPLGDPHSGLSIDMDTLVIYLETLQGTASPIAPPPEQVERGREVWVAQSCADCHALPLGTDRMAYDVGTGGTFDTPTVNWLWLSAPYYHDGRADTLQQVFTAPGAHQLNQTLPTEDIDALVAYLLTLPTEDTLAELGN